MNKKTILYLAYGSNLNVDQMSVRCPNASVVGTLELEGYELLFKGSRTGSYATIEQKEGSVVPIGVWEVDEKDELALDRYEGYPQFYQKEYLEVALGGQHVKAMVYRMPEHHEHGLPTDYYVNTVRQGYEDFGLDTTVLDDAIEKNQQLVEQDVGPIQQLKWW